MFLHIVGGAEDPVPTDEGCSIQLWKDGDLVTTEIRLYVLAWSNSKNNENIFQFSLLSQTKFFKWKSLVQYLKI